MSSARTAAAVSAMAARRRDRFTVSANGALPSCISSRLPLHLASDPFHFGKHSHEVLSHDFADVAFAVAAAFQLFSNRRQVTDILHAARSVRDAVEIGADA